MRSLILSQPLLQFCQQFQRDTDSRVPLESLQQLPSALVAQIRQWCQGGDIAVATPASTESVEILKQQLGALVLSFEQEAGDRLKRADQDLQLIEQGLQSVDAGVFQAALQLASTDSVMAACRQWRQANRLRLALQQSLVRQSNDIGLVSSCVDLWRRQEERLLCQGQECRLSNDESLLSLLWRERRLDCGGRVRQLRQSILTHLGAPAQTVFFQGRLRVLLLDGEQPSAALTADADQMRTALVDFHRTPWCRMNAVLASYACLSCQVWLTCGDEDCRSSLQRCISWVHSTLFDEQAKVGETPAAVWQINQDIMHIMADAFSLEKGRVCLKNSDTVGRVLSLGNELRNVIELTSSQTVRPGTEYKLS